MDPNICQHPKPKRTTLSLECFKIVNFFQFRLDFERFVVAGPSTSTSQSLRILNGAVSSSSFAPFANTASQCLTDSFAVTNPGGPSPPVLCGTNSGEHIYLDASPSCNDLVFQFGGTSSGASFANRDWFIKIIQISCDDPDLPPQGCTQYFTGSSGIVRTLNYNEGNGQHLANQNQLICVRRESENCRICWFTNDFERDFAVSGTKRANAFVKTSQGCCGYGANGLAMNGFDCLVIPGAVKSVSNVGVRSQICGRMGLATQTNGLAKSICSTLEPYSIRFLSDNFEFADDANPNVEASTVDRGFQLQFVQDNNIC
ncbi:uncharacterized protein LOC131891258 [Tigriopus californicus]|uniref:uncharacterized protein LOC131891258 n=1 Tax=Tigriopus californicus TaxID=6832 RepID=UPI0027D9FD57|nr:uncharacterized protein LOC131891258 [Tigriopus californicus]